MKLNTLKTEILLNFNYDNGFAEKKVNPVLR